MKILRKSKIFSAPSQNSQESPSSNDLLIEQMKMQRQIMQTQRQREKLQAQETRDKMKAVQEAQKLEEQKDEVQDKNQLKIRKMENEEGAKNVGLYKTRSKVVTPVSMK